MLSPSLGPTKSPPPPPPPQFQQQILVHRSLLPPYQDGPEEEQQNSEFVVKCGKAPQQAFPKCHQCEQPIMERHLAKLLPDHLPLHERCARCSVCHCALLLANQSPPSPAQSVPRCFEKGGRLFCQMHYIQYWPPVQPPTVCAGCSTSIQANDIVYKLKGPIIFHVRCHRCVHCGKLLGQGEQIVVDERSKAVACAAHFGPAALMDAMEWASQNGQFGGVPRQQQCQPLLLPLPLNGPLGIFHANPLGPAQQNLNGQLILEAGTGQEANMLGQIGQIGQMANASNLESGALQMPTIQLESIASVGHRVECEQPNGPEPEEHFPSQSATFATASSSSTSTVTVQMRHEEEGVNVLLPRSNGSLEKREVPTNALAKGTKSPEELRREECADAGTTSPSFPAVLPAEPSALEGMVLSTVQNIKAAIGEGQKEREMNRGRRGGGKMESASGRTRPRTSTTPVPVPQYPFEMYAAGEQFSRREEESQQKAQGNKRRGPRTTISQHQLDILNQIFAATPKPSKHARAKLAMDAGLSMRVIQVWFQNRRSKERRLKHLCNFLRHYEEGCGGEQPAQIGELDEEEEEEEGEEGEEEVTVDLVEVKEERSEFDEPRPGEEL